MTSPTYPAPTMAMCIGRAYPIAALRRRSWCVEAPPDDWHHARGALPFRVMRRPQSASGLAAVMASLFVVSLVAAPVTAAKAPGSRSHGHAWKQAAACTPWTSEYVPPPTIRVLRSQRDLVAPEVVGTVQEVDFRQYVATTMAVEWPDGYPLETLKAGAVATKQFAWYHVIHPRGGVVDLPDATQACYDVVDTTIDQYYYPEKYGVGLPDGPGRKIMAALDETWDVTVRKYSPRDRASRFFLTGYRAGTSTRLRGRCQRLQALPPQHAAPAGWTACATGRSCAAT